MAVPSRNISLPILRKHVEQRMLQNLDMLAKAQKGKDASVSPEDEGALKQLCDLYLDSRLPLPCHTNGSHMLLAWRLPSSPSNQDPSCNSTKLEGPH